MSGRLGGRQRFELNHQVKITAIKVFVLRVPLGSRRFYSSQCAFPERNSLLVRIESASGQVGWGEGGQYGPPEPLAACIKYVLAPRLMGRSIHEVGRLWEELYALTRDFGQKSAYIEAMSALDIALWDLRGRALGQPVSALLGGAFRSSVFAYATGCYYRGEDVLEGKVDLPALTEESRSYVAAGFKMLKIKVGLLSVEADAKRVKAIRGAVGDEAELLVDCNHAYHAATAIRMGRILEQFNCRFLEEPVPPEDHAGYRTVRETLDLAIAGGEAEYTRWGFRDLIGGGCVDIAQPDLCVCGGFSEFQKIVALASAYGVPVVPHVWGSGIALAAALQAIAALPPQPHTALPVPLQNEPVVEFDRNYNPLRDDLLKGGLPLGEDGRVPVPPGPGLGVEVVEEVLEQYADPALGSLTN